MTNLDLIQRYIYAVTRRLPKKQRQDVSRELESIISDMLEERCGDITPTEHDLRVVLTELGTPSELARKYAPAGERYLIGPDYFEAYWFILRIVLLCTGFGMLLATTMGAAASTHIHWLAAAAQAFCGLLIGLVTAFGFVTLLFAVLSWKGVAVRLDQDSLDNLPPVPERSARIRRGDCVAGIVFIAVFVVVFLAVPEIMGISVELYDGWVPLFSIQTLRDSWYLILGFAALGIGRECVKLLEGRYTWRVFGATAAADVLSGVVSALWLTNPNLLNPQFPAAAQRLFTGEDAFMVELFAQVPKLLLAVILFALVLDAGTCLMKTLRAESGKKGD